MPIEKAVVYFLLSNLRVHSAAHLLQSCQLLSVALTRPKALVMTGDPWILGMGLLWRAFLNFVHSRDGRMGKSFN